MISVQPETGNTNPNRLPSTHGVGKVCHPVSGFGITSGSIRPSAFSRSSSRPLSSALLKPLLIAFLLSIFLTIDMSGQLWLADYCYRKEITIDEAQVSGTSEHLSFPVLINIASDNDLISTAFSGNVASSDGYDIVFTSSDGVALLKHQVERYVESTGEYISWVKIPLLDFDTDTKIFMYYGNSAIITDQSSTDVWNANYEGVWHLNEATDATNIDATGNTNDGTPDNSPTSDTGKIGPALDFNTGTPQTRIIIPADASLDLTIPTQWSISAWVKPTEAYASQDRWPTVYAYGTWRASLGLSVEEGPDGTVENWINNTKVIFGTNTVPFDNWGYIVVTFANDSTRVYLDGSWEASI